MIEPLAARLRTPSRLRAAIPDAARVSVQLRGTSRIAGNIGVVVGVRATLRAPSRLRAVIPDAVRVSGQLKVRARFSADPVPVERWYTHPAHALPLLVDGDLRPDVLLHTAYATIVDEQLTGEDKLSFSVPTPAPVGLSVGRLIDLAGKIYRVMIMNVREDDTGVRTIEVECWARWYDLAKMPELPKRRWTNSTLGPIVAWVLDVDAGWSIGVVGITARRDFQWNGGVDRLSALRALERLYDAEIVWDTMRRTVSFVQAGGIDTGVFFLRGKNLRKAEIETSNADLVHRLYPYGSQGTSITPVNAGVPFIEVASPYSPPPSAILVASDLTDPQQLLEHAQAVFATVNTPRVSYACGVADLSAVPGYEEERVGLGDIVTVYDEISGIDIKTRVVRMKYNVEEPWNSNIELASLSRGLSDTMRGIHDAVTAEMLGDDPGKLVTNARVTDYTLTTPDGGGVIVTMDSGVTTLLRVPHHNDTPIPIGGKIYVQRLGAGPVAIYPEEGVTLQAADDALSLRTRFSTAWLLRRFADTWTVSGDLRPVAFARAELGAPARLRAVVQAKEKTALNRLFGWGDNWQGQIGDGTRDDRNVPTLAGDDVWLMLSAGENHSMGIRADGRLLTWGNNSRGQIGDGTTTRRLTPTLIGTDLWHAVSAGDRYSLGIKADKSLWAWGNNGSGQLGDGTTTQRNAPVPIGTDTWQTISAGWSHSLGIRADGRLFAWGDNWFGKLGDGTTIERHEPTPIGTDLWVAAAAGTDHSLGIRADGRLFAWGSNWNGRLGDGTTIERHEPTLIGTELWLAVSAGEGHSLGLRADGRLFAWGINSSGQLGDGTTTDRHVPTQIGSDIWAAIDAGTLHSLGINADKQLAAWGVNWFGQIGDGTFDQRNTPVRIGVTGQKWELISAGSWHSLGGGVPPTLTRLIATSRLRARLMPDMEIVASVNLVVQGPPWYVVNDGVYVYLNASWPLPSRYIKVRMSDMTVIATLLLSDDGEAWGLRQDGEHLYTYSRSDGGVLRIIKIRKADMTRVGHGELPLLGTIVNDTVHGGYSYLVIRPGHWAVPYQILKVRLLDFAVIAQAEFAPRGPQHPERGSTNDGTHAYFAFTGTPTEIVKVRMSDLVRVGSVTLQAGEGECAALANDGTHLYAALWGSLVKVRMSDMVRVSGVAIDVGNQSWRIEVDDRYCYVTSGDFTRRLYKVRAADLTLADQLDVDAQIISATRWGRHIYMCRWTAPFSLSEVRVRLPAT